jgi:hypothetical protein
LNIPNTLYVNEILMPNSKSVEIKFTIPNEYNRFFREQRFYATYDINLESVPESILVIPLLSNILPVAWASGFDIYVEEVDADFYDAIFELKKAFDKMYPKLIKSKSILKSNKKVRNEKVIPGRSSQLFSGGLDSLATLIRKSDERPYLMSVCGADVNINDSESWKKVQEHIKVIAEDFYTDVFFIKSNFKDFLNHSELEGKFGSIVGGWWTGVQHGIGLCGLTAPLTYSKGSTKFYIASSHTSEYTLPYGSHPTIDNEMKWASTSVIHEAYELTRQQKVNLIANFIKTKLPSLQIRVCWKTGSNGGNCSKCEKCSRTIVGLLIEGIDPNIHGFNIDDNFPMFVKSQFESKQWRLDEAVLFQWKDIQSRVPNDINIVNQQYNEFFYWLRTFNFTKYEPCIFLKSGGTVAKILPAKQKNYIKKLIGME